MNNNNRIWIFLPILILTAFASLAGLLIPEIYSGNSGILPAKCRTLDMIHLFFVLPLGIIMFVLALRKTYWAKLFVLGIMAHLAFMFGFNALTLVFNDLFLVYVALFSLNVFGILLCYQDVRYDGEVRKRSVRLTISAVFLIIFALSAYNAWLTEIFTSMAADTLPESIAGLNVPSCVVHVFDLGFALPMILIGAVQLLRGKRTGLIISSIMAVFTFFVCISILGMELTLLYNDMRVDESMLFTMYVLAPLSIIPVVILSGAAGKRRE